MSASYAQCNGIWKICQRETTKTINRIEKHLLAQNANGRRLFLTSKIILNDTTSYSHSCLLQGIFCGIDLRTHQVDLTEKDIIV